MFTRDDLLDTLVRHLEAGSSGTSLSAEALPPSEEAPKSLSAPLKGRHFMTDHEIKKALTPGAQHLTIPLDTIISPLAAEWLALRRIKIVRK